MYPATHVHLYELMRSVQVPPFMHGPEVHSLISVKQIVKMIVGHEVALFQIKQKSIT